MGKEVAMHMGIWGNVNNKKQEHLLFKWLDYHLKFQRDYSDATVGHNIWSEV